MKLKRGAVWSGGVVALGLAAFGVAYFTSDNICPSSPPAPDKTMSDKTMKAIVYCEYGAPDVLKLVDLAKPTPDDDQVLVKVRAAAINPLEWHYVRGWPYIVRAVGGLRKPAETRLGADYAGVVEAVGKNVTAFKPGDEVYGAKTGALAAYVVTRADRAIVPKPINISFEQAAAIPVAAITALQGLRDKAKIQAGQKVLINGASGGVGTFAVQIAKSYGAEVTGVTSTRNAELVRTLGADHIIDYTTSDFTQGSQRYDIIFDLVGNHGLLDMRRVLAPKGIAVLSGGAGLDEDPWISPFVGPISALVLSLFGDQQFIPLLADMNKADLVTLAELVQAGKVTPVIDRTYTLPETADALRYLETGRAKGKVVITMGY